MDKSLNMWAKLVSLHPDKENINFPIKPNEKNLHQVDDACKFYQDNVGNTWIQGLTKGSPKINHTWLGKSKKKMLLGGETISFYVKNAYEKKEFDYVFCLANTEPENPLKRKKEESMDQISKTLSEVSQKLVKIGSDLERDLSCPICMEIMKKCATLTPCQHTFCSSCILRHLQNSTNCPLCKTQAVFVGKNLLVQNLMESLSRSFPNLPKPQNKPPQEQTEFIGHIVKYQDGIYIGDLVNQKREGKGIVKYNNGKSFEGGWKNDKKDGEGILRDEYGAIYKGKWLNDVMGFSGEIRFPLGDRYQGEIKNSRMHGKGVFKFASGDIYDGNWIDGLREGFGKYSFKTKGGYKGNWLKGMKHGEGKMEYAIGDIYYGGWKNDMREGKGILSKNNGCKYEGDWKEDEYNGFGKYLWEDGAEYEGTWLEGMRDGKGTMKYANGEIYQGEWKDGSRVKGVLKLKNGDAIEGNWVSVSLLPEVKIEYLNGNRYEGRINTQNLQKHGKGILTLKDGNKSDGIWENDKFINTIEQLRKSAKGKRLLSSLDKRDKAISQPKKCLRKRNQA